MERMEHLFTRAALAALMLGTGAAPALAQGVTIEQAETVARQQRAPETIHRILRIAEERRLRGDCYRSEAILADAGFETQFLSPADRANFEAEIAAQRRRPCPDPTTPAARPTIAQMRAAGAQVDAEARQRMRDALTNCDQAAFERARTDLLAILDQMIAEARADEEVPALTRERDEVRRMNPPVCNPPVDVLNEIGEIGQPQPLPQTNGDLIGFEGLVVAIEQLFVPRAGIGVERDGPAGTAPEEFAGETGRSIRGWGIEGGVDVPVGDTHLRVFLGYSEARGDTRFTCPTGGGVDCGIVYGDNAPSGSSGIIAPFGLTGTTEIESTSFGGRAEVDLFGGCVDRAGSCGASITGYGYAHYSHEDRDHHLTGAGSGGSGGFTFTFAQDRQQEIQEDRAGAGLGLRLNIPLAPRLSFSLSASAGGYYRSSELNSVERNTSNFGPPSDRDFTLTIRDSDHGFGLQVGVQPGIRIWAKPGLSFSVGGFASYRSQTGAIFNPSSGDQVFVEGLNTRLRQDGSYLYGGFISVSGVF